MDIYGWYQSLSLKDIEAFVSEGQEEHLYLDFKQSNESLLSRDDRKNLAKALSAFANSDGGLIVWGVDCRKDEAGRDVASKLKPISRLTAFLTHLNSLSPQLVSPAVDRVQHRVLPSSEELGFAITFVPSSPSAPHMAKGGEDRYYKRSGSSFLRMEHFEVADMFGSRQRPLLTVYYRIGQITRRVKEDRFKVIVGIQNSGRSSAHYPFLALSLPSCLTLAERGGEEFRLLGTAYGSRYIGFSGKAGVSVHPGMSCDVTAFEGLLPIGNLVENDLRIEYRLAAEGFPLVESAITLSSEELMEAIREKAG